jgi:predicted flap endonuclease-1-like 5' DNA nuclease
MGFLLAKILILLAVAAIAGALFAYWWFRRHYEDVTLEYTRSRDEWTSWRRSFEDRLAARPAVDLNPLSQQVAGVDAAVRAISIPQPKPTDLSPVLSAVSGIRIPTAPAPVDLAPVQSRLDAIEQRIGSIKIPAAPAPTDLSPLSQRLEALEKRVAGISIPQPKDVDLNPAMLRLTAIDTAVRAIRVPDAPSAVDLAPTQARLERLEQAVRGIVIPPAKDTDLTPITSKLQQLQTRVDGIRMPDAAAPVDLAPTQARLDRLEQAVRAIHVPPSQSVDLNPVLERLSAMQARLDNPPPPPAPPVQAVAVREGSKNLLSHAGHGKPDDLKQIKGVKRVLERTLHKVGVYYFWQIADWSREDVKHVDSVLPAFKGRIDRDHWVTQAGELQAQPSSAKPPGN